MKKKHCKMKKAGEQVFKKHSESKSIFGINMHIELAISEFGTSKKLMHKKKELKKKFSVGLPANKK